MEEETQYRLYAGVDWAAEAHEVCAVSAEGKKLLTKSFEHSAAGLAALAEALVQLSGGSPGEVAVSIETPRGAVVEGLLARGLHVYSINPKQLDRLRDRHTVAGAKDDRLDAYVLADSLRHDMHLFRRLEVDEPLVLRVRELSRVEAELSEEGRRLANRLREQLLRYFPQLLHLSPAADDAWLWSLLKKAPTPEAARKLTRPKLDELLRHHRIRRLTGQQLHDALKQPSLKLAPGSAEAAASHVRLLLPRLELVAAQAAEVGRELQQVLEEMASCAPEGDAEGQRREHSDVEVLLSLPGAGRTVAAAVLAEGSQALKDRDYSALRAHAGQAPVTRRSGKQLQVCMRFGCSRRLRQALYHWARVAAQHDEAAKARYKKARGRGHSHGRALRSVGDWLLRVLFALLKSDTLYNPARAAGRLAQSSA